MAKDFETQKRNGSVPEHGAEKVKKVKNTVAEASTAPAKKRKATEDVAPVAAKKSKTPAEPAPAEKKSKAAKQVLKYTAVAKPEKKGEASAKPADKKDTKAAKVFDKPVKAIATPASEVITNGKDKKASKKEKVSKVKVQVATNGHDPEHEDEDESDDESDGEIDDQTAALLKGFESDGDEEDEKMEEGYTLGKDIPTLDKTISKGQQKKLKKLAKEGPSDDKPGVVYVGRIPHGFYENEMRAYFKQFGNILNLRLSRNRRTGASRHFAFIQFESAAVANIVAKTMDSYLMFGHLLKVKFVPEEQVPADVFKGANKRFKKVPWNKIEGRKLEQGASEEVWDKRVEAEEKRRDKKAEKLKSIGYEFEAPKIKSAKNVSKKEKVAALEPKDAEGDTEMKTDEAAPVVKESLKPKKQNKKSKDAEGDTIMKAIEAAPVTKSSKPAKQEKKPKAKAGKEVEAAPVIAESSKPTKQKKNPKPKASKAVEAPSSPVVAVSEEVDLEPSLLKEERAGLPKPSKKEVEESISDLIAETTAKTGKKDKKNKKEKAPAESKVEAEAGKAAPIAEQSSKPKSLKKKKSKANVAA